LFFHIDPDLKSEDPEPAVRVKGVRRLKSQNAFGEIEFPLFE